MSDPPIIDLRQASLSRLLDHLGNLVAAIQRSNERYVRQERELSSISGRLDTMAARLDALRTEMHEGIQDVRSDLVLMENRLLNAEQAAARADVGKSEG